MKIVDFEKRHIEEAQSLAMADYNAERQYVKELPKMESIPDLSKLAGNGLGVAAFDQTKMIGFLACGAPFDNAFGSTDARGVFSPMGANAARPESRARIYAAMYQAAADKWVKAGAVSHGLCLYAHDEALHRQLYHYGFGLRCMDAIRPMELIELKPCAYYDFAELAKNEFHLVYPLYLALNNHFCKSPIFMRRTPKTQEEFIKSAAEEGARCFAARHNGQICACLIIAAAGETFAAAEKNYRHISDAYCLPQHRGKGVYQNLLNFAISILKAENYTRLGVDFESINPNAYAFWLKYFTVYTYGVVRRIDERIMY